MYDYQLELGKLRLLSRVTHWVSFGGLFLLQYIAAKTFCQTTTNNDKKMKPQFKRDRPKSTPSDLIKHMAITR
jgi:hypothetical protein